MKISINLLPPEIIVQERSKQNFYRIQFIGVVVILILVFLTSLTFALQILQSRNIGSVSAMVSQSEQKVSNLKNTQASLILLKDRLSVINQYLGVPSKQSSLFNLVEKLAPPSFVINNVTVDKAGTVVLLVISPDSESLDNFIKNISEEGKDQISGVSIDALNRGRDGYYRLSLKMKTK